MHRAVLAAAAVAIAARAAASAPSAGRGGADDGAPEASLALELRLDPRLAARPLAVEPARAVDLTPPPCVADFCQARVDVPGMGGGAGRRASRTELFVSLLDRAGIEPVASIAWFFVVTGLRVDWTPANLDDSYGASAGGWGNVFVRLRLRTDAWSRPVVPVRPRERMRQERERAAARERARELERLRSLLAEPGVEGGASPPPAPADQRPARLSRT